MLPQVIENELRGEIKLLKLDIERFFFVLYNHRLSKEKDDNFISLELNLKEKDDKIAFLELSLKEKADKVASLELVETENRYLKDRVDAYDF